MTQNLRRLLCCFLLSIASGIYGQVNLNPSPSRALGHPQLTVVTANPNLIEGRELFSPGGLALDTSLTPPALYVSDTFNNRVLAWRNATQFANAAPADLVIGQNDPFTTGSSAQTSLFGPTGLAVDAQGNLYVVDSGRNRILRFPTPFSQSSQLPDLVIGQPNLSSQSPNGGGSTPSERTISLGCSSNSCVVAYLAFDSQGNLFFADAGNHRVLRYPVSSLNANAPAADLVLGQSEFSTRAALDLRPENRIIKTGLNTPAGLAIDPAGRLYVSDALSRVLVYTPPFSSGKAAARIMGVVVISQGQQQPPQVNDIGLIGPNGLFMIGNNPGVVDTGNSRILLFPPFDQWPAESTQFSPRALSNGVVGQVDTLSGKPNRGLPEPAANTLAAPFTAAFSGSELFVVDTGNNRVLVFPQQSSGAMFASATRVLGQLDFPFNAVNLIEGREFFFSNTITSAMVIDFNSSPPHLYVADTNNNRILGFRDVRRIRTGDKADLVIGQPDLYRALVNYPSNDPDKPTRSSLFGPTGVALDSAGNLYVADTGNSRVLRFPKPFDQAPGGLLNADLVIGQRDFSGTRITDPTERTMRAPVGLAFAGENGLLVSDSAHNRVLFFPGNASTFANGMAASKVFGQPNFTSSASGNDDNRFNTPLLISTDTDDRLYVADSGNSRIQIFNRAPVAGPDPRAAVSLGGLNRPRGVFVSSLTGEIWVADTNNNRAVRFRKFDELGADSSPQASIQEDAAISVTQDSFGDLYIASLLHRIAVHYANLAAINAANASRVLAPGVIASLYPAGHFGDDTQGAVSLPLPREMGDVQVLVGDQPAPLYYVSRQQINFAVPMSAPSSGAVEVQVVQKSTGQILGSGSVPMDIASPALFTVNQMGTGQVAAVNQDGTQNSPDNRAARGSVISLYGTGQGFIPNAPADGEAPSGPVPTPDLPRVWMEGPSTFLPDSEILYSGLSPCCVGVWQINVRIPMATPPGAAIQVFVQLKSINSNRPAGSDQPLVTTIAVKQ